MIAALTSAPLWVSALIVVGLTTFVAMLCPPIIRWIFTLEKLTTNNEVAGFKFATVGVLYAVLLAFAIIVVWQKYSDADSAVAKEAGAVATLYHLSHGIGDTDGAELRAALTTYLKRIITDEWPAMDQGKTSQTTKAALEGVYAPLLNSQPRNQNNSALMSEIFYELDVAAQARRARLVAAEGAVPNVVWFVLFGGAAITIAFTFFFGTRNLRAQSLMTGMLALLIFSEMFIIVAIDRPFTGAVKVQPEALQEVLDDFTPEPAAKAP